MPPPAQKTTSRATSNASVAFLGGKDGSIQKQTTFHPVIGSLFCLLLQIFKNKENKTLQIHEALIVCIKHQTSNHSSIKYQKRKKKGGAASLAYLALSLVVNPWSIKDFSKLLSEELKIVLQKASSILALWEEKSSQ